MLAHPWVTGELALGHLSRRSEILGLLQNLPQATVATDDEVLTLIDKRHLFGLGIGYVDAHLMAATTLTTAARLWTRDKRLAVVAVQHGLARVRRQRGVTERGVAALNLIPVEALGVSRADPLSATAPSTRAIGASRSHRFRFRSRRRRPAGSFRCNRTNAR